MSVKTYSKNIMETGTVSLTAGTAHADFPLVRLFDRNISDLFKTTAAVTTEIRVDQGATGNIEINTCIIAADHNLTGETLDIQHSPDGAAWTDATTQFAGTDGVIIKTLTGGTKRYWRLKVTSPSAAVEIPELFFSPSYDWEADPSYPLETIEDQHNIQSITDAAGSNYYLKKGDPKKIRKYNMQLILETQKDNLLDLWADWGGYKPFYITDHDGTIFFTEIIGPLNLGGKIKGVYGAIMNLREVLV
ncbi:MAG: hypothetical protein KAS66_00275 [Candidatus Omnitrophica bacterium]|nr:hypothetical protein [Candidatus Omnitrophota bacterium]